MAKILIVDDEEQLRDVLKTVLQDAGHDVVEASNGNVALEQFRQTPTDLIITDIVMPDKEGLETIIDFRRMYPQVKIIAMSGGGRNSPQDYLDMAKKLGAAEVIAKPFSIDDFLRSVETVLQA
jgi:DNA-binding response OmpR family regulator